MSTQLWLSDTTLPALIGRMAASACSTAPELVESQVLQVIEFEFRRAVSQTEACALQGVCSDLGPAVWGGRGRLPRMGTSRPAQIRVMAGDIADFPRQISLAVVSSLLPSDLVGGTAPIEERLTTLFRQALLPYLFENKNCGHATECDAPPSDPFVIGAD